MYWYKWSSEWSFSRVQSLATVTTLMDSGVHVVATHPWSTCSWPEDKKQDDEQNPLGSWSFLFINGIAVSVAEITPCGNRLDSWMEEVPVSSLLRFFFDHCDICGCGGVGLLWWLLHHHWLLHHWLSHWLLHHRLSHWLHWHHTWLSHWLHWHHTWLSHRHWLSHWCHTWLQWHSSHWLLHWNRVAVLVNHRLLHLHIYYFKK